MKYIITCEPQGDNPGREAQKSVTAKVKDKVTGDSEGVNDSCMVVYLERADQGGYSGNKQEVGRVGFVRRNTKNPRTAFDTALRNLLKVANDGIKIINEQQKEIDKLLAVGKDDEGKEALL